MTVTSADLGVLAVIGILILAFIVFALRERKRQRSLFQWKIRQEWGNPPSGEWTQEELDSISHYTGRRGAGRFQIDDITWRDLDMDEVFLQMNQTVSSCGEDYLYSMLRLPEFQEEVLEERNRLAEFFASHKEEREQIQMMLRTIGKRKGYSVCDYIEALAGVPRKSIVKYVLMGAANLISILLFFVSPLLAVFLLLLAMTISGITHYRESQKIEKYLSCLSCLLRILKASEALGKCHFPELEIYTTQIRNSAADLQRIRRKCVALVSAKGVDLGFAAVLSYLNTFLLFPCG